MQQCSHCAVSLHTHSTAAICLICANVQYITCIYIYDIFILEYDNKVLGIGGETALDSLYRNSTALCFMSANVQYITHTYCQSTITEYYAL